MLRSCLKCGYNNNDAKGHDLEQCPECLAIYSMVEARLRAEKEEQQINPTKTDSSIDDEKDRHHKFIRIASSPLFYFPAFLILLPVLCAALRIESEVYIPFLSIAMPCAILAIQMLRKSEAKTKARDASHPNFICNQCGYSFANPIVRGNTAIELFLWIFGIIFGIFYSLWRYSGNNRVCPQCQSQSYSKLNAQIPAGQVISQQTKTCPECAEVILAAAKKCKHCGSMLL